MEQEKGQLGTEVERFKADLEILRQELGTCQLSKEEKDRENVNLSEKNLRLEEERVREKREIEKLERTAEEALTEVEGLKSEVENLNKDLCEALEENIKVTEDMKKKCDEYEETLHETCDKLETVSRENEKLTAKIVTLEKMLESKCKQCEEIEVRLKKLEEKHEETVKTLEEKKNSLRDEKLEIEKENGRLCEELAVLRTKCLMLEESSDNRNKCETEVEMERLKMELVKVETGFDYITREKDLMVELKEESEKKCIELKDKLESVECKLAETVSDLQSTKISLIECKNELNREVERNGELTIKLSDGEKKHEMERSDWSNKERELLSDLEKVDEKIRTCQREEKSVKEDLQLRMKECEELARVVKSLKNEIEEWRRKYDELLSCKVDMEQEKGQLGTEVERFKREMSDVNKQLAQLKHDKLDLEDIVKKLTVSVFEKEKLIDGLREEAKEDKIRYKETCERHEEEKETIREQLGQLEQQLSDQFEKSSRDLDEEKRERKNIEEEVNCLRNVFRVLSDLCHTDDGQEQRGIRESFVLDQCQRLTDLSGGNMHQVAENVKNVVNSHRGLMENLRLCHRHIEEAQTELDEQSEKTKLRDAEMEETCSRLSECVSNCEQLRNKYELLEAQYGDVLDGKQHSDSDLQTSRRDVERLEKRVRSLEDEKKRAEEIRATEREKYQQEYDHILNLIDGVRQNADVSINQFVARVDRCEGEVGLVKAGHRQLIVDAVELEREIIRSMIDVRDGVDVDDDGFLQLSADDQLRRCNELIRRELSVIISACGKTAREITDRQVQCDLASEGYTETRLLLGVNKLRLNEAEQMSQPATSGICSPIEGGPDALSNWLTVSVQEGIPPYKLLAERCRQLELYNEELTKELRSLLDSTGECSFVTAALSPSQSIDVVTKLDDVHRLQLLSPSGIEGSPEMSLQDLQEENAMLYATKTELENKLMTAEADRQELEQTVAELKTVQQVDKDNFKMKMDDFQRLLNTVTEAKEEVEHELGRQREEYEDNLRRTRSEKLMELIQDHGKSEAIVKHMTSSEDEVARLRDELRKEREEKEFIRLRNSHLLRECKLYQGHISDLERQVNIQRAEIDEAMEEHKETIRLLAEIRLEQEMCRQEHRGDLSKIEVELQRLESHFGSVCSTPQAMSVVGSPECPNTLTQSDVVNTAVDANKVKPVSKNYDGGDGNCDGGSQALKQKHYELIDELSRLHRELITIKQFKDNSVKENRQLREALLKEKSSRSQRQSSERSMSTPSHPQLSRSSSVSSLNSLDQSVFDFSTETLALKEKVIVLTDARNVLLAENAFLRRTLREQEDLVDELRKCLSGSPASEDDLTELDVTSRQITLLQQQRDDLVANVAEVHAKDERINQLAAERYDLEEQLAKERQLYREKSQQKEMLEVELLKERIEREKQMREYQQLQDMIRQRERIEKQLGAEPTIPEAQSQKTLPADRETRIREKETILVREKERLASEIAKRVTTRDVKLQVGDSYVPREYRRRATMPKDSPVMGSSDRRRHIRLDCGCQSEVGTMKMYAHCRYHVAVEKLRKELRKQDECRRRKATISAAKDRKI